MPIFQAAISSSYNVTEETLLVSDVSDYVTNTQSSHLQAEFTIDSYYKVQILKPDSSTFVWSNQSGPDISIPSVSVDIFDGTHVLLASDPSGDYDVSVTTVPAWNALETYDNIDSDTVYHSSTFWEATGAVITSEPAVGNTDWDIVSLSSLGIKYVDSVVVAVTKSVISSTDKFSTTFFDSDGTLGISVTTNCSAIQITDNSNYINGSPGHAQSDFSDYRVISMLKPDGQTYLFSSVEFDDTVVDQVISPASSGNNDFFYQLDDQIDKDGVYEFTMCNYPTWDNSVTYPDTDFTVVFYNGELYKLLQESTGNLPNESGSLFWELYVLTDPEDEFITRYCTCAKIAVLCISTYECYESLVRNSFCSIKEDFCNDDLLCENKTFLDTVKLRILIDEIGFAVSRKSWDEVKDIFNLIRNICGCLC